jgi:hypothetical protein
MALGDTSNESQPETPARGRLFVFSAAVVRFKEMGEILGGNGRAGVPDFQDNVTGLT